MSIDKRPNGSYRARWREIPGGPQKTATFDRKIDAQRHLTAMNAALLHGTYVDPAAGKVRVKEYAHAWADQQPWRRSTRLRVMSVLDQHIVPRFGALELRSVTPSEVRAWVGAMTKNGLAASTVQGYHRVLASVMTAAVVDKLIAASPCSGVKLPRRDSSTSALTPLSVDQVHALADAVPERVRALVLMSAGPGLRQGEACRLTRDRVDFLRRRVTIDRQLICIVGEAPSLAPPKTLQASVPCRYPMSWVKCSRST